MFDKYQVVCAVAWLFTAALYSNSYQAVCADTDANGNLWMVGEQESDSGRFFELYKLPYKGDFTKVMMLADVGGDATSAKIRVNDQGDAVVVWMQSNDLGVRQLYTVTMVSGGAWSKPLQLSSDTENVTVFHKICLSETGQIALTWNSHEPKAGSIFKGINGDIRTGWSEPKIWSE